MISLKNVSKYSNSHSVILKDIHLEIQKGEFVTIVGRSGSGKSSLLNLIAGIDFASEGSVEVSNRRLSDQKQKGLDRWRGQTLGLVFQFFHLIPGLTAMENVMLAMDFCDVIPKKQRRERAAKLLADLGLEDQLQQFPATLSGGEQQRVALARALANNPPLLLADEPTGNLDSRSAAHIYSLFKNIHARGVTIVMVTHDSAAHDLGSRTLQLKDGKIVSDSLVDVDKLETQG